MIDIPMAKTMAKTLKKDLESHSVSLPYSTCLEIVAHQFNKKDWNTYVGLAAQEETDIASCQERSDDIYQTATAHFNRLMRALFNNDYDSFMEDGSKGFKARVSRQNFEGVHEHMRNPNYKATFLEELQQAEQQVFLWKIHRADNDGNDTLARLHLLDGKVEHFWLN